MPITLKDDSNLEAQSTPPAPRTDLRQRRRMLLAMAVLLIAVIIVFVKDRELWFASTPGPDSESNQTAAPSAPGPAPSLPAVSTVTPSAAVPYAAKKKPTRRASSQSDTAAPPMIAATERAVLPPLEV